MCHNKWEFIYLQEKFEVGAGGVFTKRKSSKLPLIARKLFWHYSLIAVGLNMIKIDCCYI